MTCCLTSLPSSCCFLLPVSCRFSQFNVLQLDLYLFHMNNLRNLHIWRYDKRSDTSAQAAPVSPTCSLRLQTHTYPPHKVNDRMETGSLRVYNV